MPPFGGPAAGRRRCVGVRTARWTAARPGGVWRRSS